MPFVSDNDIEKTIDQFLTQIDHEVDYEEPTWKDPNPNFRWSGGWNYYRAFDDRRYFAHPPCLGSPFRNRDVKFEKLGFFYMKFSESGKLTSIYYEEVLDPESGDVYSDVDGIIQAKILDARKRTPSEEVSNPNGKKWDRQSILAFYLDNSDWNLIDIKLKDGPENGPKPSFSFHFHDVKVKKPNSEEEKYQNLRRRNWSFFNAQNHDLPDGSRYLTVQNHHNKSHRRGERRSDKRAADFYKLDIFYRAM